jgi:hypothetical protein
VIDWLTLILDVPEHLTARVVAHVAQGYQICKWCPATGDIEWVTPCRESIRSDSHQVTVQVTPSRVVVQGSPARSLGLPNNVWGSDDLRACAAAHVRAARRLLPHLALPGPRVWRISRVDVTENFAFGSAAEVRQALAYLRQYDGGRYKLDTRRGETVYWSPGSAMRAGKAYHKGPHLRHQLKKGEAKATAEELELADLLLRLELTLGGKYWSRRRIEGKTQWGVDLAGEYLGYWSQLIGSVEVTEMSELELIKKVAKTEGQAMAAYRTWTLVKAIGHREASESMRRSTWYLHKKILFDAGLNWGDLSTGQIVQLRRRPLVMEQPVRSWEEVRLWKELLAA